MEEIASIKNTSRTGQGGFYINPPARRRIVPAARPIPKIVETRSRRATFKKADVTRAISAAAKAGLVATSFEVTCEGTIRVFGATVEGHASLFDQWSHRL